MVERIIEAHVPTGFGGTPPSPARPSGRASSPALLMLMTLQVVFLAPSSTAGAISLEREKQTLELLIATPISSLAIVLGKLLSALVYVFLLIAASIPLMAVVFVFGGVAPEDVLRGYIVLVVTALGLGSFGCCARASSSGPRPRRPSRSSASSRSRSARSSCSASGRPSAASTRTATGEGPFGIRSPAILAYLNPFVAQADVMCGTESTFGGGWCGVVSGLVPSDDGIVFLEDRSHADADRIDGKGSRRRRGRVIPSVAIARRGPCANVEGGVARGAGPPTM